MSNQEGLAAKEIGGKAIVFRELNVEEIRNLLADTGSGFDILDVSLFEDVRLPDIPRFTTLTPDDLAKMRPSQIDEVVKGIKERNPHFFGMLARITQARVGR